MIYEFNDLKISELQLKFPYIFAPLSQRKRQHPLGSDRRRPASLFEPAYQKDKGGNGHRSQKLQNGNLSYKRRGEAAVRSMRHNSMALEQERLSEAGQDR